MRLSYSWHNTRTWLQDIGFPVLNCFNFSLWLLLVHCSRCELPCESEEAHACKMQFAKMQYECAAKCRLEPVLSEAAKPLRLLKYRIYTHSTRLALKGSSLCYRSCHRSQMEHETEKKHSLNTCDWVLLLSNGSAHHLLFKSCKLFWCLDTSLVSASSRSLATCGKFNANSSSANDIVAARHM